jgi:hypothetical protein
MLVNKKKKQRNQGLVRTSMSVLRDICELKIWYMTLLIYIYHNN